jgi:hypothetical protein
VSGGWKGSDRRRRLPSSWAKIRAEVLQRDPTCQLCFVRASTHCDHIEPKKDNHSKEALRGVCEPCHMQLSSKQGNDAQREKPRPTRARPPEVHPGLLPNDR